MQLGDILKSRLFLKNLVIMVVLTLILFWLAFALLKVYTRHGSNFVVPDFSGMTYDQIRDNKDFSRVRVVVFDSIYDNSRPGGVVVDQDPPAGTEVKPGRTINLTVVSKQQEMVSVPDLGNTVRSARSQLEAYGLVPGRIIEVSGEYEGLLQGALYLGRRLEEGAKVPKGARIDLQVTTSNPGSDSLGEPDPDNPDQSF
jgi:eukaryotic-like serine/threonine-protein kinase